MPLFYENEALIKKAINGDSESQYKLAIIYCIQENSKAAAYWLLCAVEQRHKKAIQFFYALKKKNLIIDPRMRRNKNHLKQH